MSRIANSPISVPSGVDIKIDGSALKVKGNNGELGHTCHPDVGLELNDNTLTVKSLNSGRQAAALAGTTRSIVNNMVIGVSNGFEKKLTLVGVGYRAQTKGKLLNLTLGFSHPVEHKIPDGITIETPSQTEVVVKGADKQRVGQVAAEIRAYRPPEPYKGKGVRYNDEHVVRKEAKKK